MNDNIQHLSTLWPIIVSLVFIIVWAVRLEGKIAHNHELVKFLEDETKVLKTKHESLDSKFLQELSEVKTSLARIEGALGVKGVLNNKQT